MAIESGAVPRFSRRDWLIVAALLLAAGALRVFGLEHLPPGLWFDEGLNGCDALDIAHGGPWKMVFPAVFPREPLLIYPIALFVKIFGPHIWTVRLPAALVGTLAPALLYLWIRRAAGFYAALCAAIFLVTFRWHLHFSRIGLRTIYTPTLACAYFACLWMALDTRHRRYAVLAGVMLGLGIYAYLSWYFFIPVALVTAAVGFLRINDTASTNPKTLVGQGPPYNSQVGLHGKRALIWVVAAAVMVATPMMIHYWRIPTDATGRTKELSLFGNGVAVAMPELLKNARDASLMLFWRGDHVGKHNIPWKPALEPVGALLFFLGLAHIIRTLRRSTLSLSLLLYLVCCTMPTVFSKTDSANFLRTLILTPAVASVVGLGADALRRYGARHPRTARLSAAIPLLVLAFSAISMLSLYFRTWANIPGLKYTQFNGEQTDIARFALQEAHEAKVFVPAVIAKESYPFRFLTSGVANICSYDSSLAFLNALPQGPVVVIESPTIYARPAESDPFVYQRILRQFPRPQIVYQFQTTNEEGEEDTWAQAWLLKTP